MVAETGPKAEAFALKSQLLSEGRTDRVLAQAELLELRIKVYAEGGENGLHAHHGEEHSFVILDGQANFYDKDGKETVVNKYEGIMLPRGTLYRFQSTGSTNLILLRVGAGSKRDGTDGNRLGPNGVRLTHEENYHRRRVPIEGKFFGA